jgi:SET domain-containing protein
MLLIPYYIARSNIHGMGVFSAVDLHLGDLVWRYDPHRDLVITIDDFRSLTSQRRKDVINHAQWYPNEKHFVLGCDGDYFMNHADDPTLSDHGEKMMAARNLKKGTELTCDYRVVHVLGFRPNREPGLVLEECM